MPDDPGAFVAGVDGARGGWVVVTIPARGDTSGSSAADVRLLPDLRDLIEQIDNGSLAAAAIDMPIGLPADGPRPVDAEARRRIGPRRSSVFPAPVRSVLKAESYADACEISRAVSGRAISRQLFAILPKIREVDGVLTPALQDSMFEMHPEVSFTELTGAPMQFHKRFPEGRRERLDALCGVIPDVDALAATRVSGAQPDDVLDALVGAWTAQRYVARTHIQLGGDIDERGLRMEVVA